MDFDSLEAMMLFFPPALIKIPVFRLVLCSVFFHIIEGRFRNRSFDLQHLSLSAPRMF
jgi:hypothetical protein